MPYLEGLLPDTIQHWVGHPYMSQPIPLRLNRLLCERRQITLLSWEMLSLLFSEAGDSFQDNLPERALSLFMKYERWWDTLDIGFHSLSGAAMPLLEFQYDRSA